LDGGGLGVASGLNGAEDSVIETKGAKRHGKLFGN
jgi:hypothetical protein